MKDPREYENYGQWMNDAGGTIPFKHCFSDICQRLDDQDAEIAKLKGASSILQDALVDIRSMTNDLYLKRMVNRALSKFEHTIQR